MYRTCCASGGLESTRTGQSKAFASLDELFGYPRERAAMAQGHAEKMARKTNWGVRMSVKRVVLATLIASVAVLAMVAKSTRAASSSQGADSSGLISDATAPASHAAGALSGSLATSRASPARHTATSREQ